MGAKPSIRIYKMLSFCILKIKQWQEKKHLWILGINLLGKAGVAVPLMPVLPLAVQNTVPWIQIRPRMPPISPKFGFSYGSCHCSKQEETKRNDFKAMVSSKTSVFLICEQTCCRGNLFIADGEGKLQQINKACLDRLHSLDGLLNLEKQ